MSDGCCVLIDVGDLRVILLVASAREMADTDPIGSRKSSVDQDEEA
jgi:hypothetical protein